MRDYKNILIYVVLTGSIFLFILGLSFPILSTKTEILGITLKYENIWLFTSIKYFFNNEEYLLGAVILFFTFIFPIIKYLDLINRVTGLIEINERMEHILSLTDKWSMLDVFIVALLILNFKMNSEIIYMKIKIGTSFLAASIIVRMMISSYISHKARQNAINTL